MSRLISLNKKTLKSKLVKPILIIYFIVGFIEIIAEYNKDTNIILLSKPLLMPLLIIFYICLSKKINLLFILSLLFALIANVFFISSSYNSIILGTIFFLIYRVIVVYIVVKLLRFPGYFPLVIGSIPFLFVYLFVANATYNVLGNGFYLFVMQGILMIIFGGYTLGNYIFKKNTANTFLLASALLFTITQYIIVMKFVYESFIILQPLAMLLFIVGQYFQCSFMLLEEKKKIRLKVFNSRKK